MTRIHPDIPIMDSAHFAISKEISIAARSRDITIATLPTAAWALCLARRLSLDDVTFGEVVSGRNIDLPNGDAIVGPSWQYVPVRVKFEKEWRALDLLEFVQRQHLESAQFEGIGLKEVSRKLSSIVLIGQSQLIGSTLSCIKMSSMSKACLSWRPAVAWKRSTHISSPCVRSKYKHFPREIYYALR